jgi:hypothetical protein
MERYEDAVAEETEADGEPSDKKRVGLLIALLAAVGAVVWYATRDEDDDFPLSLPYTPEPTPRKSGVPVTSWRGLLGADTARGINFHRLRDNPALNNYRGGLKPKHTTVSEQFFRDLARDYGIRRIITLNADSGGKSVPAIASRAGLEAYYFPMGEESLPNREKFEQIKAILRKGNTLVHCTHGADRTGAIIGRYYVEEGIMSVDAAFADMLRYKSGSPYSSVANFVRYGPR